MKVDVNKLKAYILGLHAGCDEHNLRPISSRAEGAFEKLDNVYGIITKLRDFTSFLDCHVFKKIVKTFKIDESRDELKYPEKLQKYLEKHTVSEFIEICPELNKYTDDTKELVIILDLQLLAHHTPVMSEIMNIGQVVAHIMNFDETHLLIHDIGVGSVKVTFLIPTSVAERIFSGRQECIFSQEQIKEFRKVSITMLKCNGYEFDLSGKDKLLLAVVYGHAK